MTTSGRRYTRNSGAPGPIRPHASPGLLAAAVVLACLAAPLRAQSSRIGGEVALASQLVDQGLAITPTTPVLQGAIAWTSPNGWSLGLAGGMEIRSPGRPVVALARVSRSWTLSDDWRAQASLLYYDYRRSRIPDRADANLSFAYRDIVTFGFSAVRVGGSGNRRLRGAADMAASWPLTQHLSLSAGAGVAQTAVRRGGYYRQYPGPGHDHVLLYGYGNLGLAWTDGPWRLQMDRTMNSLGQRRAYGSRAPSDWVATLSRSF